MANPEHLEILNQGVDVWNRWKGSRSNIKPDLSDANLSNVNLIGMNLLKLILKWSNFRINLMIKSLLMEVNFKSTDLKRNRSSKSRIVGANL